jgi:hypothetical protein
MRGRIGIHCIVIVSLLSSRKLKIKTDARIIYIDCLRSVYRFHRDLRSLVPYSGFSVRRLYR